MLLSPCNVPTTSALQKTALASMQKMPAAVTQLAPFASPLQRSFKREFSRHAHYVNQEKIRLAALEKELELQREVWAIITENRKNTREMQECVS